MKESLFGPAQVCDPFLQDCLLVLLDACEDNSHAHIGEDEYDSADRREGGAGPSTSKQMRRRGADVSDPCALLERHANIPDHDGNNQKGLPTRNKGDRKPRKHIYAGNRKLKTGGQP